MDVLVLGAGVLLLTLVVYLLATLGTKETPFEEAIAVKKFELDSAHGKGEKQQKKPKVKKTKYRKDEGEPSGGTSVQEIEAECEATLSSPVPEASPSQQSNQEKKKDKKKKKEVEDTGCQVIVEEVQEKDLKVDVKKLDSAPTHATASSRDTAATTPPPASTSAAHIPSSKETKGNTKGINKETSTSGKEMKTSTHDSSKENKNTGKESNPLAKGYKEKKNTAKVTSSSVKDTKNTGKDAHSTSKEVNANVKDGKESKAKSASVESNCAVKEAKANVAEVAPLNDQGNGPYAVDVAHATEKATSQDKKKKKEKKSDISSMNESKLLPMVQRAPLSGTEIQTLIDVLLNKQQQNNAGGDWVKKGRVDPITQLRRQLEEVESRLRDKDEAHSALSAKITDLCSELHGERSRSAKLKTQLEESAATYSRQQEIAAANAKTAQAACMNELRASLDQEYQIKFQQQQQLVEQLQSATNDKEVTALRSSLTEAEMQGKIIRQEHEALTQRCQQYEEHIRGLEEKRVGEEATRAAQITELQVKLQSGDATRAQTLSELAAMENERESLRAQIASGNTKLAQLQHSFQEKLREKTEVDSRLIQVESELISVRQVIVDQNTQIERLKEEKESLASQSVRPAAEGQENGDVHAEHTIAPDTTLLQSILNEKEQTIEEQTSELVSLKKEIARLKEDLDGQREKNNELREKNHKVLEALTITEEKLMARLKQVDEATGVVEEEKAKVRSVLRKIFPEVIVDDGLDQGAFLSEFETKALQVATQTAQPTKPEVVEVVKYVEKEISVEDPALKNEVEKLSKENSELKKQVASLKENFAAASNESQKVKKLQDEITSVNERVAHYQAVLADTENLLKSLQASVESEEVAWKNRLSEKERDLHQLVADKANLQLQVKQLEDTLENVKPSEDIHEKLRTLHEHLQQEQKEKVSLQEKLQQAEEHLSKNTTQDGCVSNDSVLELKAENEKLRALVTVGQDASRQQEQLIEQLQKELTAAKTLSSNGPSNEEKCPEGASSTQ